MAIEDTRAEDQRALLRAQPWGDLLKKLTVIAFKRIRHRSLSDAKDLAQSAIADAYRSVETGGWDPERGPLMGYLVSRVIATSSDERRRKRNTCEVWLDEEDEDNEETVNKYEAHLAADQPSPEQALQRLRFAHTFHDRLVARLAADPLAIQLIALMKKGISKPSDLATAIGRPLADADIVEARRRIRYHAHAITAELSSATVIPIGRPRSPEVTQ